jgi:methylmalonyl-CoA mutase cobalamin-binding subunit
LTTESTPNSRTSLWTVHDVVIGLLSGGGVGLIAGLFLGARGRGGNTIALIVAVVGSALGVALLLRSHRRRPDRFFTPGVIASWVLLALSILFIGSLALAVATFE